MIEENENYQSEETVEVQIDENENCSEENKEANEDFNKKEKESINVKKEIFSWIRIFVIAIVIAFVINNFIIMNANVPSGSMKNTIQVKDRMIGLRTAYWFSEPKRGDIIIFENPDYNENSAKDEKYYVKRLIGLPGETVTIKDAKIYINDSETPLDEPYLPEEWTYVNGTDEVLEYAVPENSYFMLGDNRNSSHDARFWTNTYVEKSGIIAKAEFVYWPWGHKGFFDKVKYVQ